MRAVVQHHPNRWSLLPALLKALPGAEVVTDPKPHDGVSPWRCYRACLETAEKIGGTVTIIQDDALPCPHFLEVAERACAARAEDPVTFFITGRWQITAAMKLAQANDHRFALLSRGIPMVFIPTVATAWPADKVSHFLQWAAGYAPVERDMKAGFRADDGITGVWLRRNRMRAWATNPCLVDHPDRVASLVRQKPKEPRTMLIPWEGDPREIVWQ